MTIQAKQRNEKIILETYKPVAQAFLSVRRSKFKQTRLTYTVRPDYYINNEEGD
jgi:hypothetical protein